MILQTSAFTFPGIAPILFFMTTTVLCSRPGRSGYSNKKCRCAGCVAAAQKYRRARWESPEIRESIREYRRRKKARLVAFVDGIKLERGCVDCGYRDNALALQFDHVRGSKVAPIATLVHALLENDIPREIAKCEVRCANCHLIKTSERRKALT